MITRRREGGDAGVHRSTSRSRRRSQHSERLNATSYESTYIRVLVYISLPGGLQTSAWTYIAGFGPAGLEEYAVERWEYPGNRI